MSNTCGLKLFIFAVSRSLAFVAEVPPPPSLTSKHPLSGKDGGLARPQEFNNAHTVKPRNIEL